MDKPTRGLSRTENGIRIRVYKARKKVYDTTLYGDPYSTALLRKADAQARRVRERISVGLPPEDAIDTSTLTNFADGCQQWLDAWQGDPDMRKKYRRILQAVWLPEFHMLAAEQVSEAAIRRVLANGDWTIKTQKNYLSPLRMVLDFCKVSPNPTSAIRWSKKQAKAQRPKVTRYTPQQRADIIAAIDYLHEQALKERAETPRKRFRVHWTHHARVYFPILFAFGPRPGEALGLRYPDYDGTRWRIHATHSDGKRKNQTKTGDNRLVYVPEWARPRIEEHTTRFADGPVFIGNHGKPLYKKQNLNAVWRDALGLCGLPEQDPYVCRHTRAAELLSMGRASIQECAYQLGHSIAMFEWKYSEFIEEYADRRDYSHFESVIAHASPEWGNGEVIEIGKG
ncbi:MAG: tyrosine-type recombinase/integrase [Pseudomonadota bacterium]